MAKKTETITTYTCDLCGSGAMKSMELLRFRSTAGMGGILAPDTFREDSRVPAVPR